MSVKLISYSTPAAHLDTEGIKSIEDLVAYCARVSNPSNQLNKETNDKLLRYLINHKHWSPFEVVTICMEINTTRDIARQILRHRSFAFQEFSQRYADPTRDLDFQLRETRFQDLKNRQNSVELRGTLEDELIKDEWLERQRILIDRAKETYKWAVEKGIAKEQARAVLPEGNIESRIYMSGTLRSWITYIALREKNGTQREHIQVAKDCKKVICNLCPSIQSALGDAEQEWII